MSSHIAMLFLWFMGALCLFQLESHGNKESGKKSARTKEQAEGHNAQDEMDIRNLVSSKERSGIEMKEVDGGQPKKTGDLIDAYNEPGFKARRKDKGAKDTKKWKDIIKKKQYRKKKKATKGKKETKKNKPKKNIKAKKMSKKQKNANERSNIENKRKNTKSKANRQTKSITKEKKGNVNEKNTGRKPGRSKLRKLKARNKEKKQKSKGFEQGSRNQIVATDCIMKMAAYSRLNDRKASIISKQV